MSEYQRRDGLTGQELVRLDELLDRYLAGKTSVHPAVRQLAQELNIKMGLVR